MIVLMLDTVFAVLVVLLLCAVVNVELAIGTV